MNSNLVFNFAAILAVVTIIAAPAGLQAQDNSDDDYTYIADELGRGLSLQQVAENAFENADDYWTRDPGAVDGDDDELSSGEAVNRILNEARDLGNVDPDAMDIVRVTNAVIDAWPNCEDTFDAVRTAVTLNPDLADEIVASAAYKRDCNCHNGGLWLDQRVSDRIRVEMRHAVLDVPLQCSCSQIAMYAGIAGLPENRAWNDELPEAEKEALIARMTERVTIITERTASRQSLNNWECGCTDVNVAASMQGIEYDELRDGTFDGLADKYTEEAGDTGLVIDTFGVIGTQPENYWGDGSTSSRENTLRREGGVYRGDFHVLDPFDPDTEYDGFGDRNFADLGQHSHTSPNAPTNVFISEYLEGWNDEALQLPPEERDPDDRNRVIELYNGSDELIDLGSGQYVLEIYGHGDDTDNEDDENLRAVIGLNGAVESRETFVVAYSESDDVIKDRADVVTDKLDFRPNETLVVRQLGSEMVLNCRVHTYAFLVNFPPLPFIRNPDDQPILTPPPGNSEIASPN